MAVRRPPPAAHLHARYRWLRHVSRQLLATLASGAWCMGFRAMQSQGRKRSQLRGGWLPREGSRLLGLAAVGRLGFWLLQPCFNQKRSCTGLVGGFCSSSARRWILEPDLRCHALASWATSPLYSTPH